MAVGMQLPCPHGHVDATIPGLIAYSSIYFWGRGAKRPPGAVEIDPLARRVSAVSGRSTEKHSFPAPRGSLERYLLVGKQACS